GNRVLASSKQKRNSKAGSKFGFLRLWRFRWRSAGRDHAHDGPPGLAAKLHELESILEAEGDTHHRFDFQVVGAGIERQLYLAFFPHGQLPGHGRAQSAFADVRAAPA